MARVYLIFLVNYTIYGGCLKRGVTQLIQIIRSRLSIETYDDLGILNFLRTPHKYVLWSMSPWSSSMDDFPTKADGHPPISTA